MNMIDLRTFLQRPLRVTLAAVLLAGLPLSWPMPATASDAADAAPAGGLPLVTVHKSPQCGCCVKWIEHLRAAGFAVEAHDGDPSIARARLGVPDTAVSCHTAEVDGYFVEGHVPVADVRKLLAERPAARGIAVPGMPLGSPGMEAPIEHQRGYRVLLIDRAGASHTFSQHAPTDQ